MIRVYRHIQRSKVDGLVYFKQKHKQNSTECIPFLINIMNIRHIF
jgi:hypothetical protein